jgi:hypothetical protein
MGMSDIRVRRSRLLRATPRRHPDADTSFGSQAAHDRQTVREPDVRMSRRYGTAAPRTSSINQTVEAERRVSQNGSSASVTRRYWTRQGGMNDSDYRMLPAARVLCRLEVDSGRLSKHRCVVRPCRRGSESLATTVDSSRSVSAGGTPGRPFGAPSTTAVERRSVCSFGAMCSGAICCGINRLSR